jgi:UPF0271 protein
MKHIIIDINVDVGEGLNNEAQLMPFVSSCNIACGGHAGDFETMRTVVRLAKKHNVKVGAHPSFPDKANFGRTAIEMSDVDLDTSIKHQIRDLRVVLKEENMVLHHIKPHGALYNMAAVDVDIATVVIEVMKSISLPVKLYVPYGSVIEKLAKQEHIPVLAEAFADRNYNEDLTLVPRSEKKALILDPEDMFEHVYRMILHQKVKTLSGVEVVLKADTFCVHGDHPEAVMSLQNLTLKLKENNIGIL